MRAVGVGLGVIGVIAVAVVLGLALVGGFGGREESGTEPVSAPTQVPTGEPTADPRPEPTTAPPTIDAPAGQANCEWVDVPASPSAKDVGKPATTVPATGTVTMKITTNLGVIEVRMDRSKLPCTAASFAHLAGKKYFDGTGCHRMVDEGIFVLQCGDPAGDGTGGPRYRYADENLPTTAAVPYGRGVVAMANGGPGTNGSQFFICFKESPLPPNYTVLGTVTKGLNIVDAVAKAGHDGAYDPSPGGGHPKTTVTFTTVTVA
jgi:peptidyl-prolyl cis-trans isomerase B (cyclophilin B)